MNKLMIVFLPESALLKELFDDKFNFKYQIALCFSFGGRQSINVFDTPVQLSRLDLSPDIAFVYDNPVHFVTKKVLELCLNKKDVVCVSYHKSTLKEYRHRECVRDICKMNEKYIGKNLFEIETHHNSGLVYDATKMLAVAGTVGEYNDALEAYYQAFPSHQHSIALAFLNQLFILPTQEKFPDLPKELMEYQDAYETLKQSTSGNYKSTFNDFRDRILAPFIQEKVSEGD